MHACMKSSENTLHFNQLVAQSGVVNLTRGVYNPALGDKLVKMYCVFMTFHACMHTCASRMIINDDLWPFMMINDGRRMFILQISDYAWLIIIHDDPWQYMVLIKWWSMIINDDWWSWNDDFSSCPYFLIKKALLSLRKASFFSKNLYFLYGKQAVCRSAKFPLRTTRLDD